MTSRLLISLMVLGAAVAALPAAGGYTYAQESAPDYASLFDAGVDFDTFPGDADRGRSTIDELLSLMETGR